MSVYRLGTVEFETARAIRLLRKAHGDKVPPEFGALAAGAITLARLLDAGAGLSTAAVQRELRTTLDRMVPKGQKPTDGLAQIMGGIKAATDKAQH